MSCFREADQFDFASDTCVIRRNALTNTVCSIEILLDE